MPSVLFADGRRVEIRTRSAAQLHDQLTTVARAAADGRIADLDEDVLNRCQRFLRSTPVRESAAVDTGGLRDLIDDTAFAATVAQWWRGRAAAAMGYATVMRALGAHDEAAGWATDALVQAAKVWAARHGETYLESKWLPQQLARASAEVADRYRDLLDMPLPEPASDAPWWDPVADAVRDLGGDLEWPAADDVVLARVPGVTTWQTGDRIHVIRGGRDVFALSDAAGRAWRQVVFRHSVAAVVERAAGSGVDVAPALTEFVRLGLVGLDWRGRGPLRPAMAMCEPAEPYTPTPFAGHPILGLGGATRPGPPAVPVATLSPLPADRFASAALDLTWANVVTENSREDLVGALKSGQGAVADVAAHRLVAMTARMVLAAYGIAPLPADVAPVATLSRLVPADTPGRAELLTAFRAADAVRFAPLLAGAPGGDGDAARALEALDALVDRVRSTVVGIDFPASFDSRDQWRRTLEISYDWLRIGTHLGVRLPLAEAGDLLATGGAQPHVTDQGGGR
ncbi:hypothetical protein GCM10009624_09510 [Gordonia sinesedis]